MIATLIISISTFVLITLSLLFFPKIKLGKLNISTYWVVATIGATLLLIFNLAPIDIVWSSLTKNDSVNPLKIIVLFFSMTILSIFLDEVGLFKFLASYFSHKAKNHQVFLFVVLYILISILTVFTSNDVVILTFTPFICFFAKNSKINPIPYLVGEFVAANTWSLMLMIGNPTNIYLAGYANITFFEYFKVMFIPTLVGGTLELFLLLLIFKKPLHEKLEINHEINKINDKTSLFIGLICLSLCIIFLVISSYINIEMWIISLSCALSLIISISISNLIRRKSFKELFVSFKKLPYPLIPFFISMAIIVVSYNYQGISEEITSLLGRNNVIWTYGFTSFVTCNFINNIPMSILYADIISTLPTNIYYQATYATIVGSNIGAFLTPMGALAGIMFTSLVNEHDTKYSFIDFIKYGALISIPVISIILLMLFIMF